MASSPSQYPQRRASLQPPVISPRSSSSATRPTFIVMPPPASPSPDATTEARSPALPTSSFPTASPKQTTFAALPSPRQSFEGTSGPTMASSSTLKPNPSLLNRLGRKLSIGKGKSPVMRRGSLGSPVVKAASPGGVSLPLPDEEGVKEEKKVGLQRGQRALGRSKSEGTATPKRGRLTQIAGPDVLDHVYGRSSSSKRGDEREATRERENEGEARLFWEERLGICWDGRERVNPDFSAVPMYNSNSDFVPAPLASPARVVYASTLSTFPPRPPLKSRDSSPPPTTVLTPASQIIADYRLREQQLAALSSDTPASPSLDVPPSYFPSYDDDSSTAFTSEDATPIPTPVQRTRAPSVAVPPADEVRRDSADDESDTSSTEAPRFGRESEDSSTSLESLDSEHRAPPTPPVNRFTSSTLAPDGKKTSVARLPVMRFALVDGATRPTIDKRTSSVPSTKLRPSFHQHSAASSAGDSDGEEDWRECE